MTGSYQHWLDYAKEYDSNIPCSFLIHNCSVAHDDGSRLYLTNCLVEEKDYYWIIFTEHLGYFVFHKDDVQVMYTKDRKWE